MKPGDQVFMPVIDVPPRPGVEPLRVLRGTLVVAHADGEHEVSIDTGGGPQTLRFPAGNVHPTLAAAEKRLLACRLVGPRADLLKAVRGNRTFYPSVLLPPRATIASGNPLRAGEPFVVFAAQSNTWGTDANAQKLLMNAGAIWDDLRTLLGILDLLAFAGDYPKKLAGKYLVLELQSFYVCLQKLAKIDASYRPDFDLLTNDIRTNLAHLELRTIRDKIAAHRDADLNITELVTHWRRLTRYNVHRALDVFVRHIEALRARYPEEVRSYFSPAVPMPGIAPARRDPAGDDAYEPFDPPVNLGSPDTTKVEARPRARSRPKKKRRGR